MNDDKIDKTEVYLPSRDGFSTGLVVMQTPDAYYYRSDSLWEFLTPLDTEHILEDSSLKKIRPEFVDDLVDLWDSSQGLSEKTGDNWTLAELAEFTA